MGSRVSTFTSAGSTREEHQGMVDDLTPYLDRTKKCLNLILHEWTKQRTRQLLQATRRHLQQLATQQQQEEEGQRQGVLGIPFVRLTVNIYDRLLWTEAVQIFTMTTTTTEQQEEGCGYCRLEIHRLGLRCLLNHHHLRSTSARASLMRSDLVQGLIQLVGLATERLDIECDIFHYLERSQRQEIYEALKASPSWTTLHLELAGRVDLFVQECLLVDNHDHHNKNHAGDKKKSHNVPAPKGMPRALTLIPRGTTRESDSIIKLVQQQQPLSSTSYLVHLSVCLPRQENIDGQQWQQALANHHHHLKILEIDDSLAPATFCALRTNTSLETLVVEGLTRESVNVLIQYLPEISSLRSLHAGWPGNDEALANRLASTLYVHNTTMTQIIPLSETWAGLPPAWATNHVPVPACVQRVLRRNQWLAHAESLILPSSSSSCTTQTQSIVLDARTELGFVATAMLLQRQEVDETEKGDDWNVAACAIFTLMRRFWVAEAKD